MGQYANQPDFATRAVGPITPDININENTFLDSAAIYVGTGGNLKVIIAGTVGPFTVSKFNAINNGGIQYTTGNNLSTTTTGSGTGLTVDITAVPTGTQNILTIVVNTQGTGYENGDFIEVIEPGQGGVDQAKYRIEVSAGLPTSADAVEFINIQDGSFVPVIVDYVLPATATAASDLVAIY